MNTQELKERYLALYDYMANSKKTENMKTFGRVMTQMMDEMIVSNPSKAEDFINKLESIKWKNYMTPIEADKVVSDMEPKAPWSREQWRSAMNQYGFELEEWPCYNRCALYVTMNMIMSDSGETLAKFVQPAEIFKSVHALAVDKLKDQDERFNIRKYFEL